MSKKPTFSKNPTGAYKHLFNQMDKQGTCPWAERLRERASEPTTDFEGDLEPVESHKARILRHLS
jgi:hypothetical protein